MQAPAVGAGSSYRISSGDTLWAIASRLKRQGVGGSVSEIIKQIQKLNPQVTDPNRIVTGRSLKLPGGSGAAAARPRQAFPRDEMSTGRGQAHRAAAQRAVGQTAPVGAAASAPASGIDAAIAFGMSQLGAPYVGGASPFRFGKPGNGNTYQQAGQRAYVSQKGVVGYDCSGLMVTMLKKAGIDISRFSSSRSMKSGLPEVSKQALQPGDLLVKNGHVSMYIGDGKMIESVPSGVRVTSASKYINDPSYTGHRPG
ncbi:MAG: NlpC/P60 family protein [Myxococcales bacterium]|nr:NlpC/P60 family protein [Myxococcales bacterium]